MNDSWELSVAVRKNKLVFKAELVGPAVLGRQKSEAEPLYSRGRSQNRDRVIIALKDDKAISREHALIEPYGEGGFRLTNLSEKRRVGLGDYRFLEAQTSCVSNGDALLLLGRKTVRIKPVGGPHEVLQGLAEPTLAPGRLSSASHSIRVLAPSPGSAGFDAKETMRWLQAAVEVLQSAACSADFFDRAAQAIIDLVQMDSGRVILWHGGDWQTQALSVSPTYLKSSDSTFSRTILGRVRDEKRTFWQVPAATVPDAESIRDVEAVVAAPILDRDENVLGVLYGERRENFAGRADPIGELEAMFVELLAQVLAAGLARLEQEQAAIAARVQFEQFFTPELARQLARQPDLLLGRDAEVTLLFCDIRGFSRISERLGPAGTFEWVGSVMGMLSDCVRAHAGVLVDYIGDELVAMWGAPEEQPEHARLACRAALDMLAKLPELNLRWQSSLKEPLALGIGINTGLARVGNTGSHHKFKYGPLGNMVNLASRVQGATKHLKCRLLISGATLAGLDDTFATRRLCQVRVVNIAESVTLHELAPQGQTHWPEAKQVYEEALADFESGEFSKAARSLGNWRGQHQEDEPALLLLYRAVRCMVEGAATASSDLGARWEIAASRLRI